MYKLRETFPTNDERSRQYKIQRVLFGEMPVSRIEKLAAAVLNNAYVNSVRAFKIERKGEEIQTILNTQDLTDDTRIFECRRQILKSIEQVKFQPGDTFQLSYKTKTPTLYPEAIKPIITRWNVVPSTNVSLIDFEKLMFNNKILLRYYENVRFVDYMLANLKYYLDVDEVSQTEDNMLSQAKLLQFMDKTEYNEYTLIRAFYDNTITYNNMIYDTSFVPKYPVLDLKHQLSPIISIDKSDEINYWNSIDLSTIDIIPIQYLGIFMVFPFKNGFYVQPTGKITKIPLKPKKRMSLINLLASICSSDDLEAVLDETCKIYTAEDILHWTLYESTLRNVGLGILLLRRYFGDILTINPFKIALVNEYTILSWLTLQCNKGDTYPGVLLPCNPDKNDNTLELSRTATISLALIRDIINAAQHVFDVSVLISNYCILESDMYPIYTKLNTSTEKYVFLLMVYQYYPYYNYERALRLLNENLSFGKDTNMNILSLYKPNPRHYVNAPLSVKLAQMTVPIVRPQDLNSEITTCSPTACPDLYEFTDYQLNELAKSGTLQFTTTKQFANYIDLCI
uniref:CLPB1 protein n=1 Tax=Fopius arisanus TaxID=64838 RepID=A0A0C9RP25_9HYME